MICRCTDCQIHFLAEFSIKYEYFHLLIFSVQPQPQVVGHNIYILCHQLALYNKDIGNLLKPNPETMDAKTVAALRFYNSHTAQIEVVRHDRTLEQIVFPIPEICEYLTEETKSKVRT